MGQSWRDAAQFPSPSRGNGVIDTLYVNENGIAEGFPSPLGEMGLSIYIMAKVTELNALEFPSPLGEMGLSIAYDQAATNYTTAKFPSPLGEMGLSIFIARGMILAYEDG